MRNKELLPPLATNRKAQHDYFIEETIETGIVLTGTEIKSIRAGKITLRDGYAQVRQGELWLCQVHISPYDQGNQFNVDPLRNRKLLAHHREISRLAETLKDRGLTLVPLKVYLKRGRAKLLLGVARGKHSYDKRETLKKREQERTIARTLKNY